MLTGRQIDIVKLLYVQEKFITIQSIAQQIGVSQKTIRNDLMAIRKFYSENEMGIVLAKPHEGVMVEFSKDQWEQFLNLHREEALPVGDENDIRCEVIRILLKKKSVTFGELERKLYTGRGTIERELEDVKNWFQNHDILFEKKRGKGLEIFYNEFLYRMAMWQFIGYCKSKKKSSGEKMMSDQELTINLLDGFDDASAERCICNLEKKYGVFFSYESHQQLLFLVSLTISRIRKKSFVTMEALQESRTDSGFDDDMIRHLIRNLEMEYHIFITEEEKAFLLFAVRISDIQGFSYKKKQNEFEYANFELCCITVKLTNLLGEIINIDLKSDTAFTESLMLQLRSTIQRLRYHIVWHHPLLKQVKQKYSNIFAAVYAAGVFFNKEMGMEINEHEMCCIALHLGGAMERNISILTTCVVCNYGIGVSQLLRERLERNITDLKVQGVYSIRDIRKLRTVQCDFIISTLPLEDYKLSRDVVVVEHLLPVYDLKKIENKMKKLRKEKLRTRTPLGTVRLQKELFNREFVWLRKGVLSKEEIIRIMCKALLDAGYVTEGFEASVFEHEENAPTHLGMGVAIPHGFAKYVIRPVVAYASLKRPVLWDGKEEADLIFMLAFNLDEASGMKEETIKFYSVFLDLLDNEEELKKVRNVTEISELVGYMNQKVRGDDAI